MTEISRGLEGQIRARLLRQEPVERVREETAAVALIIKTDHKRGSEFLLIKRAERAGDPWSGQIALPGGRVEHEDLTFEATAVRETLEEIGVDLASDSIFLGYMSPFQAITRRIEVVPAVFGLSRPVKVHSSREVSSHRWISVTDLRAGTNAGELMIERGALHAKVPSFSFGDYVVWGLTQRILARFAEIIEIAEPG